MKITGKQLFYRSRLRLALWYTLVMGGILLLSGLLVYRVLTQSRWVALEREIESIAGTLHDSLEPMLPVSGDPTHMLQRIFPDLCLAEQPCSPNPTLIQRHTIGVSDRTTYYIRLFDDQGHLLAFSPNQPQPSSALNPSPWQTLQTMDGTRYRQFTTVLHSASHLHSGAAAPSTYPSWGYLQTGRTLTTFDAETDQIRWILALGFPLALGLVSVSSWWLSGLAIQPIYKSYEQQQQFTANAAHELRSPLASLLATVEVTLRLTQQQDIALMLQTVERQGRRLSHLITDLLLLTSLEQNAAVTSVKPCCLTDLTMDLTEEYQELATASAIHLSCQSPTSEVYSLGDESQLYRLIANLIANAIQYTSAGGSVLVSLESCDRIAIITIKDTGIGIPPTEQNHIFERFYRVDSDRSRKTGGTGLGLAIAQAITHRHQGRLTVQSDVGQGSIFSVHLPLSSVK